MSTSITPTCAEPATSMRARRGVALTLNFGTNPASAKWTQMQPHTVKLPRMPNPKPCFRDLDPEPDPTPVPVPARALTTKSELTPSPPLADDPHLQEIIPCLWVAFAGSLPLPPCAMPERGFTHVLEIAYPRPPPPAAASPLRTASASRLALVLPHAHRYPAPRHQGGRLPLALTPAQLRAAIAFVLDALPAALAARSDGADGVRVLVTVPPGRVADAMGVVGGYLALAAGRTVEEVLRCIDEEDEEEVMSMWKGEVSGQEIEQVERVVRAWEGAGAM